MDFDAATTMLLIVAQNAAFVGLTLGAFWGGVLALRGFGRRFSFSLRPLGFVKPPQGAARTVAVGVGAGLAAIVLSAALNVVSRYSLRALGYPAEGSAQQPLMDGISSWVSQSPLVAIPLVFLTIGFLTPVAEEILFRGGIFGGLQRLLSALFAKLAHRSSNSAPAGAEGRAGVFARSRSGARVAFVLSAILSSAMFASLHLEPVIFVSIFALAVGLCWLRSRGGLLAPIAAHATFNSFTVSVLVLGGIGLLPG